MASIYQYNHSINISNTSAGVTKNQYSIICYNGKRMKNKIKESHTWSNIQMVLTKDLISDDKSDDELLN